MIKLALTLCLSLSAAYGSACIQRPSNGGIGPQIELSAPGMPGGCDSPFALEISMDGDSGTFQCRGTCSVKKADVGFTITDDSDDDTFNVPCAKCRAITNQDGSIKIEGENSGWFKSWAISLGFPGVSGTVGGDIR